MKNNGKPWSEPDREALKKHYPDTPTRTLAKIFRRSEASVYGKAKELGLKKTEAFLNEHGGRLDGACGASTRFKKGEQPWNKGTSFNAGGRSPQTRFGKGHRPHNWKPIGSERVTHEGYRQRKVTDTGYPPRDWVNLHWLVWQEHFGEIPPGHVVVFKDGNRQNVEPSNLELITREENALRNSIHRYPPELKEIFRLNGKLKREVRNREKQDRGSA